MRKYDWILFDADNTLFDFDLAARHAFDATLSNFNIVQKAEHHDIYLQVNHQCWKEFEHKQITATELRTKRMKLFFEGIGEFRNPSEFNDFYLKKLSEGALLIKGATDLLQILLAKNFKLVIITNGLKEVQRPRLNAANLTSYFKEIIVSDEIGVAKPQSAFFEYTFQQINNPAKDSVLVVGDSLNSDIKGGNNFGLDTCWYNPEKLVNETEIQPKFEIQKLENLLNIIAS